MANNLRSALSICQVNAGVLLTVKKRHASDLRQMLYSLPRYRHFRPQPPFAVGGEYMGQGNQHFLTDALGAFALQGERALFSSLRAGDLIEVQVDALGLDSTWDISSLKRVWNCQEALPHGPKPHVLRFAEFVSRVRRFFSDLGLSEVLTPSLVPCPGLEPTLEPFRIQARETVPLRPQFLPTSPEVHLKKAMASGWHDIFEIKNCFRQGEFSPHHQAEFLMLEWYRGFADLTLIETDLKNLVQTLVQEGWSTSPVPSLRTTDFAQLFEQVLGRTLKPDTSAAELRLWCQELAVDFTPQDTFNDLFHRVLIERLEPELVRLGPCIVRRFPPSQAALARLDSMGWADRFEFYWNGLEIANAFYEVTDPREQAERWDYEQSERARLGASWVPQDPALLQALRKGLPPSGGIALGVERLYMALTGVREIRELRLFSN